MYEKNKNNKTKSKENLSNSILKKFKSLFNWDEQERNRKSI
jgi:hypothetical protein